MHLFRPYLTYKSIKRIRQILSVFIKYGFYPLVEKTHLHSIISFTQRVIGRRKGGKEELSVAERFRLAFEELGPTFIKLGQILSTRPDMLPDDFIKEFLRLQDCVPPFAYNDVIKTIEDEFGKKTDALFTSIDKEPVAAASIAQVHQAITKDGKDVVIKVQRPNICENINLDISILKYMAIHIVKYMPESSIYDPVGLVDEFSKAILKEMDFTLEASYTEKIRGNFSGDERVVIPKVYWELTGKKIITMERVSGIKIDNTQKLASLGISAEKVALLVISLFFKQVFEHRLFHGDLHSGNIFVISEDKVAFVDFGIAGKVSKDMMNNLAAIFTGLIEQDLDKLIKIYTNMGLLGEDVDKDAFRTEYQDMLLHYFNRPFKFIRLGEVIRDYIRIASRYNIMVPRDLLLLNKCIFELEGLAKVLYPDIDILKEGQKFANDLIKRDVGLGAAAYDTIAAVNDYKDFIRVFPQQLNQIFRKMVQDKFTIDFMHKGLEDFIGEIDRSSNRITFGLMVSALIIGSSLVVAANIGPKVWGLPFLGMLGFTIASVLSLWLGILILRSGKF
ncbi:MAG: AarF/ABC1/UbiB kinase family protein [Deltaproteobacteria bacterium]|nr:AarF/ABC1/UbiB kinase family protein [Deltaproteobacteria bacterium]